MHRQLFVGDAGHFNAYPAATADIGWVVEFLWGFLDQHLLNADRGWHDHRHMPIVVMIVREPGKDFLAGEPRRFSVRYLLPGARQRQSDSSHPLNWVAYF